MKRSRSSLLALLSIGALSLGGQAPDRSGSSSTPEFLAAPTPWADSVFQSLDLISGLRLFLSGLSISGH